MIFGLWCGLLHLCQLCSRREKWDCISVSPEQKLPNVPFSSKQEYLLQSLSLCIFSDFVLPSPWVILISTSPCCNSVSHAACQIPSVFCQSLFGNTSHFSLLLHNLLIWTVLCLQYSYLFEMNLHTCQPFHILWYIILSPLKHWLVGPLTNPSR